MMFVHRVSLIKRVYFFSRKDAKVAKNS
jgi:hypothetical protein